MAIDPRIAFGIEETPRVDVLGSIVRAAQAQNYLAQARENQAQADAISRKQRDEENLRGTMQVFGGDIEKALPEINKTNPVAGISLQTKLAEMRNADLKAQQAQREIETKNAEAWSGILGPVKDQASYDLAVGEGRRRNLLTPEEAGRFAGRVWDEKLAAEVDQIRRGAATFLQQQEEARKAAGEVRAVAEEGRKVAGEKRAEGAEGRAVTKADLDALDATLKIEGAHPDQIRASEAAQMTAKRLAEQFTETKRHNRAIENKPQDQRLVQVMGPQGTPIWVRENEAVGKPAAQAPRAVTGQERQALAYYNRAKQAVDDLSAADASGKSLEERIGRSGALKQAQLNLAHDSLLTADQRAYRQAQRAFTEARLRKESGAAIPVAEYANDAKTYFIQANDDENTIAQKIRARNTVLDGLKFGAGKAYEEFYGEQPKAPAPSGQRPPLSSFERK